MLSDTREWDDPYAHAILAELKDPFWYEVGRHSAWTYTHRREWLYRRVESIEFEGRRCLRRHVSVDFEFPALPSLKGRAAPGGRLVPVSVFGKWPPLIDFDFRGPHGEPLSLYKRTTNKQLDFGLLVGMIEELRIELDDALLEDLALLVATNSPPGWAVQEVISQLRNTLEQAMRPGDRAIEAQIAAIANLAGQLANCSILWAPIVARRGSDCIVKFSYLDHYSPKRTLRQLLIACSWHDRAIYIPLPHAGYHARYHADIRSPRAGIEFVRAQTRALPAPSEVETHVGPLSEHQNDGQDPQFSGEQCGPNADHTVRGFQKPPGSADDEAAGDKRPADDRGVTPKFTIEQRVAPTSEIVDRHVHVYHPPRSAPSHRIFLVLEIAATREGFISHCLAMVFALAVMMSVVFGRLDAAARNVAALAVLLAAVPLVLGYLLVRSEDPLEREGIIGVRTMAIIAGTLPLVGGLLLALARMQTSKHQHQVDLGLPRLIWAGLTITSWLIVVGVGWSWCMATRPREKRRTYRVENIAAISGAVSFVSLLIAGSLSSWPYRHLDRAELAPYLIDHRAAIIAVCALLVLGASALHGTIGGIRRLTHHGEPTWGDRLATLLVVVFGGVWIWGTVVAALLAAWQAMTITTKKAHVPLFAPVDAILNVMLVPAAILMITTTAWLLVRHKRLQGDPQLPLAGLMLAAAPMILRAISIVSNGMDPVSSDVAWIGFALWIGCLVGTIRPLQQTLAADRGHLRM